MDILKRCSGSTFCSYAKRFEKGFCSVLYVYGALPQSLSGITLGRSLCTAIDDKVNHHHQKKALQRNVEQSKIVHHPQRNISYSLPSVAELDAAGKETSPTIPEYIVKRLKNLQIDIITSILEHSQISSQQISSKTTVTNFSKNLQEMAKYYFDQGGKLFRPTITLLMSDACSQITKPNYTGDDLIDLNQYRIAMVSEMIHTASLVHDDVIDESGTRRGAPTVNARWGNRQAVLVGDFILARATKVLCSIGEPPVISTMAEIVEDLVQGELMQLTLPPELEPVQRFQHYMTKTFYKTASLFANSCKSVAMLAGCDEKVQKDAFEYGRHLGLAFQLVDDMLDYVATSEVLGKPAASDLKLGLATCPVLYAAHDYPELNQLINRRFKNDGDVEKALKIVIGSRGLEKTKELAKEHCYAAASLYPHYIVQCEYCRFLTFIFKIISFHGYCTIYESL
uniref:Decaprenyl-diphosphate synthase subunit 1 n=1 Tax=Panagrolaimus superbus TaxID=310955 RepID=A0A914Z377_9BILA